MNGLEQFVADLKNSNKPHKVDYNGFAHKHGCLRIKAAEIRVDNEDGSYNLYLYDAENGILLQAFGNMIDLGVREECCITHALPNSVIDQDE